NLSQRSYSSVVGESTSTITLGFSSVSTPLKFSSRGLSQSGEMSGYVYIPVGLTFTRISPWYTRHGRSCVWIRSARRMFVVMRWCASLLPGDIAYIRPLTYSCLISECRSISRYSAGLTRDDSGVDIWLQPVRQNR